MKTGRSGGSGSGSGSGCGQALLEDMKEQELLELLSQYEEEDSSWSMTPWHKVSGSFLQLTFSF